MTIPPNWLIEGGRSIWTQIWRVMMAQLAPASDHGDYQRPVSEFRQTIGNSVDNMGDPLYSPAAQRYRLYVGWSCPWAHRTLIVRALKGLEEAIDLHLLFSDVNQGGWVLSEPEYGCRSLRELYRVARPGYGGRCTVPMLWDRETRSIVNNESSEIIEILNSGFNEFAQQPALDLSPAALANEIAEWNELIYTKVNNGVYCCGFAHSQSAYDRAAGELFETLDRLNDRLADRPYLCGEQITMADVRLFPTLIRFDIVYHHLFKCNRRRIQDYQYLNTYVQNIYHLPGIAATCNFPQIVQEYYGNLFPLNPGGIIPQLPDLSYLKTTSL